MSKSFITIVISAFGIILIGAACQFQKTLPAASTRQTVIEELELCRDKEDQACLERILKNTPCNELRDSYFESNCYIEQPSLLKGMNCTKEFPENQGISILCFGQNQNRTFDCTLATDSVVRNGCYIHNGGVAGDLTYCKDVPLLQYGAFTMKADCYGKVAAKRNDKSICLSPALVEGNENHWASCFLTMAKRGGGASLCDEVTKLPEYPEIAKSYIEPFPELCRQHIEK